MKEKKFRIWDKEQKCFWYWGITDSYPTCLTKKYVKKNVQQYIGIVKKIELYQGDIVNTNEGLFEVLLEDADGVYFYGSPLHEYISLGDVEYRFKWIELIGNTFENKDLLNEK